jgi:hypothetical protein
MVSGGKAVIEGADPKKLSPCLWSLRLVSRCLSLSASQPLQVLPRWRAWDLSREPRNRRQRPPEGCEGSPNQSQRPWKTRVTTRRIDSRGDQKLAAARGTGFGGRRQHSHGLRDRAHETPQTSEGRGTEHHRATSAIGRIVHIFRHIFVRVELVHVDPLAPRLLIDYGYFCECFGPLPFGDFIALWHAADALMHSAIEVGYEPHEVPDPLMTSDNLRMALIHSMIDCIRPNIGRMRSRGERMRRWRSVEPARRGRRPSSSIDA